MKKVLLASGSAVFLRRNANLLMKRGFQLFTAASGAESLRLHEDQGFDLILADFKLEDMCGCTLCGLIRKKEQSRHIPIILICHNIAGSIERVEQSDADAMLLKPLDPTKLLETIGNVLGFPLSRSRRVVLKVTVLSKDQLLEFTCFSHDISTTGILLETDHQLALRSRIFCRFTLPDSYTVETEGQVIRCMNGVDCENIYGVKFVALPAVFSKAIDQFVTSMADQPDALPPGDSADSDQAV